MHPPTLLTTIPLLLLPLTTASPHSPRAAPSSCPPTTATGTMSVHTNSPSKSGCLNAAGQWDRTGSSCAVFTGVAYYPDNPYPNSGFGCGGLTWNFSSARGICGIPQDKAGDSVVSCAAGLESTVWDWTLQQGNGGTETGNNWLMPNFWTYGPNYHPVPGQANAKSVKTPLDLMVATDSKGPSGEQVGPVYQIQFSGWK